MSSDIAAARRNTRPSTGLKPQHCVALGVTGHRLSQLPGADLAMLHETVATLLARVHQTAESVSVEHVASFSSSATHLRLVSALPERLRSKAQ